MLLHKIRLSVTFFIVMLSVTCFIVNAERHRAECCCTECCGTNFEETIFVPSNNKLFIKFRSQSNFESICHFTVEIGPKKAPLYNSDICAGRNISFMREMKWYEILLRPKG
jgi:hypothetical protein